MSPQHGRGGDVGLLSCRCNATEESVGEKRTTVIYTVALIVHYLN